MKKELLKSMFLSEKEMEMVKAGKQLGVDGIYKCACVCVEYAGMSSENSAVHQAYESN